MAKILLLDIETAPHKAYVWGAWKQNVGGNQWVRKGYMMCYTAKWLDSDTIIYKEQRKENDKKLVKSLFKLLDEADIVVAHNAKRFDLHTILGRGLVHGFPPPSPYHIVDTLLVARREFRFVSNALANLAHELGCHKKDKHTKFPGFELWEECMKGNPEAWDCMREYNIEDVIVLEDVYLRMRPFMRNHPNVVHHSHDGEIRCPKCGSDNIQWRGYYYTAMGLCYRRFVCLDCGGWGRARYAEKDLPVNNARNAT